VRRRERSRYRHTGLPGAVSAISNTSLALGLHTVQQIFRCMYNLLFVKIKALVDSIIYRLETINENDNGTQFAFSRQNQHEILFQNGPK
jgi:hypothetical protein